MIGWKLFYDTQKIVVATVAVHVAAVTVVVAVNVDAAAVDVAVVTAVV